MSAPRPWLWCPWWPSRCAWGGSLRSDRLEEGPEVDGGAPLGAPGATPALASALRLLAGAAAATRLLRPPPSPSASPG